MSEILTPSNTPQTEAQEDSKVMGLIPPLTNLQEKKVDVYTSGSSQTREIIIPAISQTYAGQLNNTMNFSYDFSTNASLDRCVYLSVDLVLELEAANVNETVALDILHFAQPRGNAETTTGQLSLACNPLARAMKSLNVKFNNSSVSSAPHMIVNALSKYKQELEYRQGQPLTQPDPYNNYYACIECVGGKTPYARNIADCIEQPRSQSVSPKVEVIQVANGGARQRVRLTYSIFEPLIHPFFTTYDDITTIHRLKNFSVDIAFNDLSTCFSAIRVGARVLGAGAASTSTSNISNIYFAQSSAKLLCRSYIPLISIPQVVSHTYTDIITRTFSVSGNSQAGVEHNIATGAITLSQVPSRIYMYCIPQADINSHNVADAFGAITSLKIQTDSDAGGLSNASQQQLYQMSVRNGLDQSFQEFKDYQGSVVCLDITKGDLGGYMANSRLSFTLEISGKFINTTYGDIRHSVLNALDATGKQFSLNRSSYAAVAGANGFPGIPDNAGEVTLWKFVVVFCMSGSMVLDGSSMTLIGGASQSEQLDLVKKGYTLQYDGSDMSKRQAQGSGFFRDAGNWIKRTANNVFNNDAVRKIAKDAAIKHVLPYAQGLAKAGAKAGNTGAVMAGPVLDILAEKYGENKAIGGGVRTY